MDVDGIFGACTKAAIFNVGAGRQGNITRILQALLLSHGYSEGGVDGIFGGGTENAVRDFQQYHYLAVDGIAGKETFTALTAPR